MSYLVYTLQRTPSTKRLHLQGYVQFKKKMVRSDAFKAMGVERPMPGRAFQPQYGTAQEAKDYIVEDEKKTNVDIDKYSAEEGKFDEECPSAKGQGKRNDLLRIKEEIEANKWTYEDVIDNYPDYVDSYKTSLKSWCDRVESKMPLPINTFPTLPQHPVVKAMVSYLKAEADDRKILWIWSDKGATGKTTAAKWIRNKLIDKNKEVFYGEAKESKELAYLWQGQPIVILDCPRSCDSKSFPWTFIEGCKNGLVTSTKYESRNKRTKNGKFAHVIVCANIPPDAKALSADRFVSVNCDPPSDDTTIIF